MAQEVTLVQEEPVKKKRKYRGFIKELKEELKKVSWTSREELILCTKIVVGSTFIFGLGIYLADLTMRGLLNWLSIFVHKIFG